MLPTGGGPPVLLRAVELSDVEAYAAMRCDPVMMAELGGPLPREGIADKVARDVAAVTSDESWVFMIVPDPQQPAVVAGSVVLWSHPDEERPEVTISETGWMVLPAHQGKGLAKASVRALLERAAQDGRWGPVHAFPGVTNAASNGICRSLGFTLTGQRNVDFADRVLACNHWVIDPPYLPGSA